jgi:hypothetical protein
MPTLEPWLGDALRALGALEPDEGAATAVLTMLSLPVLPGRAPVAAPAAPDAKPPSALLPPAAALPPSAAPPPPTAAPQRAAGMSSHRLPSVLLPTGRTAPSDRPATTMPAWLARTEALSIGAAAARADPAPPLIARHQQRAILAAALHRLVPEGPPDLTRILRRLGEARPLTRVPRRPRRTLRYGVELRSDLAPWLRTYSEDQRALRVALERLFGAERVHAVAVQGGPAPDTQRLARSARRRARAAAGTAAVAAAGAADEAAPKRVPGAPTPLLVLSDLGAGYQGGSVEPVPLAEWRAWFDAQRRAGRAVVVMSPLPLPAQAQRPGVALLPWNERTTLGTALRARRGQPVHHATWPAAGDIESLARELSPALLVSPALLRQARRDLGLPPAAEALLAASDVVQSQGPGGLAFDPLAAARLRRELAQGEQLERALVRVQALHGRRADGSAIEQALIALELRGGLAEPGAEDAVQSILGPALKALAEGGERAAATADWAAHAWTRLSTAMRGTRAARQLAYAAAAWAQAHGGWLAEGGAPGLPEPAPWLMPESGAPLVCSVELRRYADGSVNLAVGPAQPGTSARHRIELPAAAGPWLEVEQPEASRGARREVLPLDGTPRQFEVEVAQGSTPSLRLRALDGSAWNLTIAGRSQFELLGSAHGRLGSAGVLLVAPRLVVAQWRARGAPLKIEQTVVVESVGTQWRAEARVVGIDQSGGNAVAAFELVDIELLGPSHQAPQPFDTEARLDADEEFLQPLRPDASPVPLVRRGEGFMLPDAEYIDSALLYSAAGWAWFDGVQPVAEGGSPAVNVRSSGSSGSSRLGPGRKAAGKASTMPVSIQARPLEELVRWATACAQQRWRLLVVPTRDFAEPARQLQKAVGGRLGFERTLFTPEHTDRRGLLEEATAPSAAVLLVGSGGLDLWQAEFVRAADAAGRAVLWCPWAESVLEARDAFDDELAGFDLLLVKRPWFVGRDIGLLAEQIARWQPGGSDVPTGAPVPAEGARSSAPELPAPAPPPSLRGRLVAMVENREDHELGLFAIGATAAWTLDRVDHAALESLAGEGPLLVLVHGITADVQSHFGPLLLDDPALARRLFEAYGRRMLAWQYRSLTVGPLANAVALARTLPAGARLHLATYSAGGVIGELLCRALRRRGPADAHDREKMLAQPNIEPGAARLVEELDRLVLDKGLGVERFVRIGAPIEGSSIFSGEPAQATVTMARALPWVGGLVSALPGIDSLLTDASVIPGAASLVPGGGVQPLLTSRVSTPVPLTVIAGVRESRSLFEGITRWFGGPGGGAAEAPQGDQWVTLASAFGGLEREQGVNYLVVQGEDVDHAAYLRLPQVRRALVDALLHGEGTPTGFAFSRTLAELQERAAGRARRASA